MLAIQLQDQESIMGLNAEGQLMAAITETVAERVARIRTRMIAIGIPVAVGSGLVTMLTFAGAFRLARTERVWTPAIWLGTVATVSGLISVTIAAQTAAAVEKETAPSPPAAF